MVIKHMEDFKLEAVRIALTSGLPRRRAAWDLGVGFSTLSNWLSQFHPTDMSITPQADLAKENAQLRCENRTLTENCFARPAHSRAVTQGQAGSRSCPT
jgi:transposase